MRCRSSTSTRSASTTSMSSPPRRSRSPPARKRARSPSTPSSRSGPASTCPATAACGSRCRGPTATDEEIDAQVDRLREQFAELAEVDRAARDGDVVTIGINGFEAGGDAAGEPVPGLQADDYAYRIGAGSISPELDAQLVGAKIGDALAFDGDLAGTGAHGLLQDPREEGAGAGAARGHRRVGQRGVRVRHRPGAPRRPRRAHRQRAAPPGLTRPAREGRRGAGAAGRGRGPRAARPAGDAQPARGPRRCASRPRA